MHLRPLFATPTLVLIDKNSNFQNAFCEQKAKASAWPIFTFPFSLFGSRTQLDPSQEGDRVSSLMQATSKRRFVHHRRPRWRNEMELHFWDGNIELPFAEPELRLSIAGLPDPHAH
jgi:hypothetical protein